jgi:probable O-glycosylation ligase (exosortase A-associated)
MISLRDLVFSFSMSVLLPMCLLRPWVGILVWSWLGYMNPHRLVWGFARHSVPWAMLVAAFTLVGMLLARDPEKGPIPWTRETILLAGLWAWFLFTTIFAWYPEVAWDQLEKVSKILLFTFLTLKFFQTRERLHALFMVIALSLGFYGLKGGLWSLLVSGGVHQVLGPEGSFIGGNTEIGLALAMVLPFLYYLARLEQRRWLKRLMQVTFGFSILAVVFTHSRGAMLGLPVVFLMLFARARHKIIGVVAIGLLGAFVTVFAPQEWLAKMETIGSYEEDQSANARFVSWQVATRLALESPLLGGGFWVLPHAEVFARYAPGYPMTFSAHSIYLSVLGDHGFPGLALFVTLFASCFASLIALRRRLRHVPGAEALIAYTQMIEISLAVYAIAGAFLTMAYWDMYYHLVSFVILLQVVAHREAARAPAPVARRVERRTTRPAIVLRPALPPSKGPVR